MNKNDVQAILTRHRLWAQNKPDGVKADLYGAYLTGADLSRANLTGAYLSGAYLTGADLSRANLTGAYLSVADLSGADLSGANLSGANLYRANLTGADLTGADLSGANLGQCHIVQVGPIGSRQSVLVYKWGHTGLDDRPIDEAMTGCFRGSLAELEEQVKLKHGDNQHGRQYHTTIAFIRQMIEATP